MTRLLEALIDADMRNLNPERIDANEGIRDRVAEHEIEREVPRQIVEQPAAVQDMRSLLDRLVDEDVAA
jgi:hypothetical protein